MAHHDGLGSLAQGVALAPGAAQEDGHQAGKGSFPLRAGVSAQLHLHDQAPVPLALPVRLLPRQRVRSLGSCAWLLSGADPGTAR